MARTTAHQWKIGDLAIFRGYSDGQGTILTPGQPVKVESIDKDGAMGCLPVKDGEVIPGVEGDTAYPDEVMTVAEWSAQQDAAAQADAEMPSRVDPHAADDDAAAAAAPDKVGKVKKASKIKAIVTEKAAKAKAAEPAPDETVAEAPKAKGKKSAGKEVVEPRLPIPETLHVLEVVHSSSVTALLAEKDALEAAKDLVRRSEETEYTLGGVLAHIQREGIHQRLGYSGKRGFEDYIEKELSVKYRKARYLINIYEYFTALGINEDRLGEIGWSKAKELLGVATKENFDELVDYAQKNTRDKLVEHIKSNYVEGAESESDTKVKMTKLNFALFADQATNVTRALDAAKRQAGTDDPNAALEHICGEWSLMNENNAMTLEDVLHMAETKFKVKLSVNRETDDGQTDVEDHAQQAANQYSEDAHAA